MTRTLSEFEQQTLDSVTKLYLDGSNPFIEALAVLHALRELPKGAAEAALKRLVPEFIEEPNGPGTGYYRPTFRGLLSSACADNVQDLVGRFLRALHSKYDKEGALPQLLWRDVKAAVPEAATAISDTDLPRMISITTVVWPRLWKSHNGPPEAHIWTRPADIKELVDENIKSALQLLALRDRKLAANALGLTATSSPRQPRSRTRQTCPRKVVRVHAPAQPLDRRSDSGSDGVAAAAWADAAMFTSRNGIHRERFRLPRATLVLSETDPHAQD
jgi:hypothetical protein